MQMKDDDVLFCNHYLIQQETRSYSSQNNYEVGIDCTLGRAWSTVTITGIHSLSNIQMILSYDY